jgi:hypothetical protein
MGTDGDFVVAFIPLLVEKGWRTLCDGVFKFVSLSFCVERSASTESLYAVILFVDACHSAGTRRIHWCRFPISR